MIKLQVIGNLGQDAVEKNVNGKTVINFPVAHNKIFKNQDGSQESKTIWVNCSWWQTNSKIVQYLKKGTQIYVEGDAEFEAYEKDGAIQQRINIHRVIMVELLGKKQ